MDEKLKNILERTITATKPLAEAPAVGEGDFLITLLGIYRISFTTLRDISYLTNYEGTEPSILDLTRKILEHGISVEYMIMKDKDAMAKRFQEYMIVQVHDEFEFYKSIGQDPSEISSDHKDHVEENTKEYEALSNDVKARKNWAGRPIDGMLDDLDKAKALNDFDISRLGQAYVWGSRLNHMNPLVVHSYLDPEEMKSGASFFNALAISIALACHLRLTTRLIDESRAVAGEDVYPEIAAEVKAIQDEFNALG
jgi:Family of unknown function (DUF5677)